VELSVTAKAVTGAEENGQPLPIGGGVQTGNGGNGFARITLVAAGERDPFLPSTKAGRCFTLFQCLPWYRAIPVLIFFHTFSSFSALQ
jgi:hypothetical protein